MYDDKKIGCEEGCYILIDDLGNPICADCGCMFDEEALKLELVKRHGKEFWEEEYDKLMANKELAKKGELQEATAFNIDDDDETKYFYE